MPGCSIHYKKLFLNWESPTPSPPPSGHSRWPVVELCLFWTYDTIKSAWSSRLCHTYTGCTPFECTLAEMQPAGWNVSQIHSVYFKMSYRGQRYAGEAEKLDRAMRPFVSTDCVWLQLSPDTINGTSTESPSGEKPKENTLKEEAQSKIIKGYGGIFCLLRSKLANQIVENLVTGLVTIGGI